MNLSQLAFVLEYIDDAIVQQHLLADYERLIAALEGVYVTDDESEVDTVSETPLEISAELITALRTNLTTKLAAFEPAEWNLVLHSIFVKYGARPLLGEPVVELLNATFLDNFMNPTAVVAVLRELHEQTAELSERVQQLLVDLEPLRADLPEDFSPLEGEILDSAETHLHNPANSGVVQVIKDNLGFRSANGALVPIDQTALRTKVIAALPIALAAASKAIDLYKVYSDGKNKQITNKPAVQQHPIHTNNNVRTVTNYVRYTVSQTVVYVNKDKK